MGTGKYISVTHSIIASPRHHSKLIYPYLVEVVPKMKASELHELRAILCENLELFIELGCEELCELVMRHYVGDVPRIMGAMSGANSYLLVGFAEKMLGKLGALDCSRKEWRVFDSTSEFMLGLRLRYLELLAGTGQQWWVLEEVRKDNYPLDDSLKICRKFGIMDA